MGGPISRSQSASNLGLLSGLGFLPTDGARSCFRTSALQELAHAEVGTRIERALLAVWTEWRWLAPRRQRNRATKVTAWLQSLVNGGGCLTLGASIETRWRFFELCGPRVLFWPQGPMTGSLQTVTSSRIGRSEAAVATFVEKLKLALPRIAEAGQAILIVHATAGADLVHRAAQKASLPALLAITPTGQRSERWLSELMQTTATSQGKEVRVFISPAVPLEKPASAGSDSDSTGNDSIETVPLRDRVAVSLAETVWNLSVRQDGNLHRLLKQRLELDGGNSAGVRLVLADTGPMTEHTAELVRLGAIPWQLLKLPAEESRSPETISRPSAERSVPTIAALPNDKGNDELREQLDLDGEWLIHWTRTAIRPIDRAATDEWLDQQLQSSSRDLAGPLATLRKILRDGTLRASSQGLRGSPRMTCFSAVPLRQLAYQRRFQTHRTRWDFEPYGLCIRRRVLETLGARPVIYGDDSLWHALPEPERPWFQQRFSGHGDRHTDWSEELEWRIAGDITLSQFRREELVVFCTQPEELNRLQNATIWPVVAINGLFGKLSESPALKDKPGQY